MWLRTNLLALLLAATSCSDKGGGSPEDTTPDTEDSGDGGGDDGDGGDSADSAAAPPAHITVVVTLDGAPAEDVSVMQGGTVSVWLTDAAGVVTLDLDTSIDGTIAVAASHPEARIGGVELSDDDLGGEVWVALERFDDSDNEDYVFDHPGSAELNDSTNYCAHCHRTIAEDFSESVHVTAASNPVVHDLYSGAAAAWDDQSTCTEAGGQWWEGITPGTDAAGMRCYLGDGALPSLNTDCGDDAPCDGVAEETGQCAACHAPGIDGALSDRDLLEATDIAYDYGVHCDVCHKVESVDLDVEDPGVAGRLRVIRPSEASTSPVLGEFLPLTFGPYPDVLNIRMGSVERPFYADATFCAGCHDFEQEVLVPGASIDETRWPSGRLPIHTTYQELAAGPLTDAISCQSCHMPPDPDVGNSADLGNIFKDESPGMSSGWWRAPGAVRRHVWFGPRHTEQRMIDLAATLAVESALSEGTLSVELTVKNSGPGHAIPTGEPMRSLLLLVEASCDGEALSPNGGDVVPDIGGFLATKTAEADWTLWSGAEAGQVIRVIQRTGEWRDYEGFGPFGDGTFSAEDKGMPVEVWAGDVTITEVEADGTVTTEAELPEGDVAYLLEANGELPDDGDEAVGWAGAPGMAFARVLEGPEGTRNVPHFLAVNVASDNRLLPQQSWTSSHSFAADCDAPEVHAVLIHRAYPLDLATERGWTLTESVMAEVRQ